MKIIRHNHTPQKTAILVGVTLVGVFLLPFVSFAATTKSITTCTFTRDLQLGVTGDDVLCLQKYLNTHGFPIAASGVGSPGHETGEYKTLTEASVIQWQKANNLSPAIGYFGARSRVAFKNGTQNDSSVAVSAPLISVPMTAGGADAALLAQVNTLKAQLEAAAAGTPLRAATLAVTTSAVVATPMSTPVTISSATATDAIVRSTLGSVISLITKTDASIKKNTKVSGIATVKDTLTLAKDGVLKGLVAYLKNDYAGALTSLATAKRDATKAQTAVSALTEKSQANNTLDDSESNYSDAANQITQAATAGEVTTAAKRLLKKARAALDDAQTAYDDEQYEDVSDLTDEADGFVSDAIDAIGS